MTLAMINAVWVGPKLGPVHAACLRSFVRHGHRTVLHVYEQPADVPDGVELADAGELLPSSRIIRHRMSGSLALFSDLLRYEIQKKELGLYVDCDCYCLRPLEDAEYIFGWESAASIANGVLKLLPNSQALANLLAIKDTRVFDTPWASAKRRAYQRLRACLGVPVKIQDMPWGFTGPRALTWYLKQHGLERHARPIDTFYPVHWDQVPLLLDPGLTIADLVTPRTLILHLANEKLRHFDITTVPPTSPLGVILYS